jgi:hypothetical protein
VVPFDAVTTFADPSENFGLRFDATEEKPDGDPEGGPGPRDLGPRDGDAEVVRLDAFRKR